MKIKGQYSTFSFRPPGVLKSSVSTSPRPRLKPVEVLPNQQMLRLAQGIDPKNEKPLEALDEIPAGMIFFCELENAYFTIKDGIDGAIITDDLHVITESIYDTKFQSQDLPELQGVELLDQVFLSFDSQWMRYNHWMGYCLSKAYLASLYTPESVQIIVPEYREHTSIPHPISKEIYDATLEKTGLVKRAVKLKDGIYKAKKLSYFWQNSYVPSSYFNFHDAKSVFSHINKNTKYQDNFPPRFFINQDQNMEPILNDEDIILIQKTLNELNIPCIDLDKMDLDSQRILFSQAELVISPHRPELINLLYCSSDTEVIEFTRASNRTNYLPAWPYLISSSNRLQYTFFDLDWVVLTADMIKDAVSKLDSI
ncbi:Capsular polysaccharide biosynthesis protein [Commensalibacter communis]|uniref:glycosyltransferase 61 family protein n=1 Tax=Commensalibacter communis TaxID=2972786 RepID=UPI0022FF5B56|nr:glycosyltransferase 61 family protein [Commensalibacter communis]CAI3951277.1 Capsular polysaccharide biosynthesis protein [Commensalibacter communis]CAI3953135.1 Capsular polysaccharide biosynthesis protein [Commensalibacter communis]